MVFGLFRRLFGVACFLLVSYAFVTVPLGRKTGWGHVAAIFSTDPAHEAAKDLEDIALGTFASLREKSASEPSQEPSPRGKTPAPGTTHVRSAHQGVPPSP